jgi:MFS family permease
MGTTAADSHRSRSRAFGSLTGNRALLRVLAAYLMFTLTEYAVWIAMLVFAYNRGGTAVAGLVAVAQLVPAAVVAPVVAPATPDQLTAANVVAGWMEAAGVAAAGLLAGVLISLAGVGSVFAVCAALGLLAALLVAGLRVTPLAAEPGTEESAAGIGEGLRLAARQPRLRLMLALLTADAVVTGALDLLVVILAIAVLGRSPGWAGYLQSAFGAGALLAATVSAVLVGRSSP